MQSYENTLNNPKIMLFITGKGPEKERYEKIIKERRPGWKNISI